MPCIRGGGCQPLSVRTDLNSAPLPRSRRGYQSQPFHQSATQVGPQLRSSTSFASETPAGPSKHIWRQPCLSGYFVLLMSIKQTPTPFSLQILPHNKHPNTMVLIDGRGEPVRFPPNCPMYILLHPAEGQQKSINHASNHSKKRNTLTASSQ